MGSLSPAAMATASVIPTYTPAALRHALRAASQPSRNGRRPPRESTGPLAYRVRMALARRRRTVWSGRREDFRWNPIGTTGTFSSWAEVAPGVRSRTTSRLRGLRVTLVERGEVTSGTTGRHHGMLHSGGRYAVNDRESAVECIEENMILRRICPGSFELNDGLFVAVEDEDMEYLEPLLEGCEACGHPRAAVDARRGTARSSRTSTPSSRRRCASRTARWMRCDCRCASSPPRSTTAPRSGRTPR